MSNSTADVKQVSKLGDINDLITASKIKLVENQTKEEEEEEYAKAYANRAEFSDEMFSLLLTTTGENEKKKEIKFTEIPITRFIKDAIDSNSKINHNYVNLIMLNIIIPIFINSFISYFSENTTIQYLISLLKFNCTYFQNFNNLINFWIYALPLNFKFIYYHNRALEGQIQKGIFIYSQKNGKPLKLIYFYNFLTSIFENLTNGKIFNYIKIVSMKKYFESKTDNNTAEYRKIIDSIYEELEIKENFVYDKLNNDQKKEMNETYYNVYLCLLYEELYNISRKSIENVVNTLQYMFYNDDEEFRNIIIKYITEILKIDIYYTEKEEATIIDNVNNLLEKIIKPLFDDYKEVYENIIEYDVNEPNKVNIVNDLSMIVSDIRPLRNMSTYIYEECKGSFRDYDFNNIIFRYTVEENANKIYWYKLKVVKEYENNTKFSIEFPLTVE